MVVRRAVMWVRMHSSVICLPWIRAQITRTVWFTTVEHGSILFGQSKRAKTKADSSQTLTKILKKKHIHLGRRFKLL